MDSMPWRAPESRSSWLWSCALLGLGCVNPSPQVATAPASAPAPEAQAPMDAGVTPAPDPRLVPAPGADEDPSAALSPAELDAGAPAAIIREYPRRPVAATFEVEAQSALAWVYAPEPTQGRIELEYGGPFRPGHDPRYERVATHFVDLRESTGQTAAHLLERLQPGGAYRYRWQFGNGDGTEWYHFRTAPKDSDDAPVHFVFGADISNDPRYDSPLIDIMSASGAAFFISMGDWPYTDLGVPDKSLAQYRASYRLARTQEQARNLARRMSMYAIYDDHEVHNDWDRVFVEQREKRAVAALRAWDEFFPVRDQNPDPLARKRYRTWRWGKHAQFFMLDTRRYRAPYKDPDSPEKTMLGPEQWAWLLAELDKSRASFKFIITTIPMDYGTTREHWQAYRDERDALYNFLADKRVRGVVFLTADQHWLSVHALPSGQREYQVGPMRAFLRKPPDEPPEHVLVQVAEPNYGEIIITPGKKPSLVFTARDMNGALLYADVIEPTVGQRPPPESAEPAAPPERPRERKKRPSSHRRKHASERDQP